METVLSEASAQPGVCRDEVEQAHVRWCFGLRTAKLNIENQDLTRSKRDLLSKGQIREKHMTQCGSAGKGQIQMQMPAGLGRIFWVDIQIWF